MLAFVPLESCGPQRRELFPAKWGQVALIGASGPVMLAHALAAAATGTGAAALSGTLIAIR